ncbi:MAG TPA: hypothetical protein VKB12_07940 [Pyrinomonadaceae bacterium]|nr:hypothetical protein [Pyrinomonadaceae bacterium]
MKTARAFLFSTFVLLSLSLSARAQSGAMPAAPDYGSVEGSTYTNQFFGLTLTFPEGWQPHGEAAKKEIRAAGQGLIGPKDPAKVAEVERNARRVFNLLTVTQYPLGASGPVNPTYLCFAERLPAAAADLADTDYVAALKKSLQATQARVTIDRDVYTESVGGKTFSVIDLTSEFRGVTMHGRYYAHVMKGYALVLAISYPTPEPLPAQAGAVKSVRFR